MYISDYEKLLFDAQSMTKKELEDEQAALDIDAKIEDAIQSVAEIKTLPKKAKKTSSDYSTGIRVKWMREVFK